MSRDLIFGHTIRDWSRCPSCSSTPPKVLPIPGAKASLTPSSQKEPKVKPMHKPSIKTQRNRFVRDEDRAQGEDGFAGRRTV